MTQSIKALEATREVSDAPETASENTDKGTPPEPQEPVQRRSWWREFLGME